MLLMSQLCCSRRYLCCSYGVRGCVMGPAACVVVAHCGGFPGLYVHCCCCYCCGVWVAVRMNFVLRCGDGVVAVDRCLVGTVGQGCWGELICGCASPILVC